MSSMNLGDAIDYIRSRALYQWHTGRRMGATPMLLGAAGMGKTALAKEVMAEAAATLGGSAYIHTVTPANHAITDIPGIGIPNKSPSTGFFDRIVYTRAGILPSPEVEAAHDFIGLLLDEVPAATMDHVKLLNSITLDYRAGETTLDPAKYFIICTGNNVNHRSGAIRLPAHFVNRLDMIHSRPDVRPWLAHAATDAAMIPPLGRAFVEARPALFTKEEPPAEPNTPFATVRSFTHALQALVSTYSPSYDTPVSDPECIEAAFSNDNAPMATAIVANNVGDEVANEFIRWSAVRSLLIPLSEIIADPDHAPVPTDVAAAFAQASYLVSWVDKRNVDALIRYTMRMRRDLRAGVIMGMRKRDQQAVHTSPEFVQFARENAGLVQTLFALKHASS